MLLIELSNAQPNPASGKLVNISAEQHRAEDLLEENRLYRQTALKEGDQVMANTLDELERVLLDVANSPDQVTPARFDAMQKKARVARNSFQSSGDPAGPAGPHQSRKAACAAKSAAQHFKDEPQGR